MFPSANERMGQIFDWDGTITGIPKSMVVRNQPFYTSSLCEPRPHWGNMSICPHRYVTAEGSGTGYGDLSKFTLLPYPLQSKPGVLHFKMDFWVGFNSKYPSKSGLLNKKVGLYSRKTTKI